LNEKTTCLVIKEFELDGMAEVALWHILYLLHGYLPSLTGKRLIGQIREVTKFSHSSGALLAI
jgi:hypothetical protein